jgi:hypothetical protein
VARTQVHVRLERRVGARHGEIRRGIVVVAAPGAHDRDAPLAHARLEEGDAHLLAHVGDRALGREIDAVPELDAERGDRRGAALVGARRHREAQMIEQLRERDDVTV